MATVTDGLTDRTRAAATAMYDAVMRGDIETFMSFVSPSIVIEEPPFLPYGGQYEGIEGLQELFGEFAQRFDLGGLQVESLVVDGNHVCALCRIPTAGRTGTVVFIERGIFEDDKAVNFRIYMHDTDDLLKGGA